jgi:hypothetical protein
MNWYKIFWYFTVADNLKNVTGWLAILCGLIFVIYTFMWAVNCGQEDEPFFKSMSRSMRALWFTLFFMFVGNLFMWTLLPSKKDALIIIVGGSVGNFVTSDSSSAKIPADLTRYLHTYMQREINDLDTDTKKELGLQTPKEKFIDKAKDLTRDQLLELLKKDTTIKVQ